MSSAGGAVQQGRHRTRRRCSHQKKKESSNNCSSVQNGIFTLGKSRMRSTLKLSSVAFQTVPVPIRLDYRFFSSFQRKNVERFLFPHLSPPGDPVCAVLGFVPANSVSSSSTTACSSDWSLLNICLLLYACATAKEMSCFRRLCGFSSFFRFVLRWDVADAFQGHMQKAQRYQTVCL